MKLVFIVLLLLYSSYSLSQYILKGNIKNITGTPIEFATVKTSVDSINNSVTLSNSLGNYYFKNVTKGNCNISISMIGYTPIKLQTYISQDTTINFILNSEIKNLQGVTVQAKNPLIQAKSDRLIINIGSNIETRGKATIDILKLLPTIHVSDKSISMAGKASVLVYINDYIIRLNGYSLLSYLNTLPTDAIKSIEIISSPPAQYDAEGNVGIIKIVMKKNIHPGWKEYLQAGYKQRTYSSYMGAAYINYVDKKFFFEGKIQGGNNTYLNQNQYYSYFPSEINTTFNPKKWQYLSSDAQVTLGYNFNANSNIIVNIQTPIFNKQTISDIKNQTDFINAKSNVTDSTILSNGVTTTKDYTYNADIFFKHLLPNKLSYFTVDAAYLNNNIYNSRPFISITQINNINYINENFNTNGSQNYNIYTSQIDFVFPLFHCTVNTGSKFSFINSTSNSMFFDVINGSNILVPSLSNQYTYKENIQAAYYSMEKNISNWSFKGGLRAELTQTNGNSFVTNQSNTNNYINLFPSIYISHDLTNKSNISINYTKRINRPPYNYLDPFKWYISKYNYAIGNPFLQPSFISNIELSYTHNNSFNAKLYYSNQINQFGQYVVLDPSNITNQIQETDNFLNLQSYGISIYKSFNQFKWLESEIQANFSYLRYLSNKQEFANAQGYGSILTLNNTIPFDTKKTLIGILNIEDDIPGIYNYRNKKNFFQLDIGFNYLIPKQRLEFRFYATDIFKTANPQYFYLSNNIKQVYQNYFDTRGVRLVIVYKLGNWFIKTNHANSPSNTEEKERLQND